jgi:hypothetical protein
MLDHRRLMEALMATGKNIWTEEEAIALAKEASPHSAVHLGGGRRHRHRPRGMPSCGPSDARNERFTRVVLHQRRGRQTVLQTC